MVDLKSVPNFPKVFVRSLQGAMMNITHSVYWIVSVSCERLSDFSKVTEWAMGQQSGEKNRPVLLKKRLVNTYPLVTKSLLEFSSGTSERTNIYLLLIQFIPSLSKCLPEVGVGGGGCTWKKLLQHISIANLDEIRNNWVFSSVFNKLVCSLKFLYYRIGIMVSALLTA